ncbi:MAG TPA: hypothetical protein VFV34_03030 [Blastocatellia bacterium]|nr:hypothetical protein [Blastocatellia bacterium]
MEERHGTEKLLVLRKLTRAIADLLRAQMKEYLSALAPLLRPNVVLGEYIQGGSKSPVKGAEKAFKDLQALYESVAVAKPFQLPRELRAPLDIAGPALEMTPVEYEHVARTEKESKTVTITQPLKWVVAYPGYTPDGLSALLANRNRSAEDVRDFILHFLAVHLVTLRQPGVAAILDALHFPLSTGKLSEFGELPITYISSSVSTFRPHDDVIIESTEISGKDLFEEIVNIDDIVKMQDQLRERLVELVKSYGDHLLA